MSHYCAYCDNFATHFCNGCGNWVCNSPKCNAKAVAKTLGFPVSTSRNRPSATGTPAHSSPGPTRYK
jgi:hypothetical protein